jgi:hypothetical protein
MTGGFVRSLVIVYGRMLTRARHDGRFVRSLVIVYNWLLA